MPIFEYNGKKYNVKDEHIDSFMTDYPDASTIMEREGKRYRVRSADYNTFMSEQSNRTKQLGMSAAGVATPKVTSATPMGETPLTKQDKIRFETGLERMKHRTQRSMDDLDNHIATIAEYNKNAPLGGGQTAEGRMKFNLESGQLDKTYITPLGNKYTSKGLADLESFSYRQAADMSVSGQLRRARLKLSELQAKKNDRAKEVHDKATEFNNTKLTGLGRALIGGQMYVGMQQSDPENNAYDVAIRQTEELIKNLQEQQTREQGEDVGFWRGVGRVVGDSRTWDFGMGDLRDAMTMMHADNLVKDNSTDGERDAYNEMMGAIHNKEQADQAYGGNASFWNRAGVMTGHMPSFMLDFAITGGGFQGVNLLAKGGSKMAAKAIGKEVVEEMAKQGLKSYAKNNGVKGLAQYAGNWTIKAMGTMGDDLLVRAPIMANTVQLGKTTTDIIDRKLGDVVVNEDGTYDFSNDETWSSAIWQGEANAVVENYSEMFGAHLDPVVTFGNMSRLANVVGAKRIGAVLSKADAGALNGIMGQTHQLFNKMGVSDYFGEVTEEYYGQMWRTMLNLDDAYQQNPDGSRTNLLATGKFHGEIWGGMALSMGLMGVGKHALTGAHYMSMKHSVNKADTHATELLGKEVWEAMRATIDLTTNDDMGAMAETIVKDKTLTDEERAAVLTYMERSMMMRGYNLGSLANKRGGSQDKDVQSFDDSYIDGYNLGSSQEMNDAKNMFDYQRQRVSAIVDEDLLAFMDSNPMNALEEVRSNGVWNDEARATILDYLNAKQVYDGMIQRVRDDIDGRIDQSNAMVNARTNRTTGMIQGATMKVDDRRVYVINGNLVQYADGSGIDIEASDNSVIVRDAETGALEQVSPDAILNIDEALDPITEMQTAADAIRQQYAQEAANRIDGVVTFNPGDTYTITGDDAQIQVQIVANDEGIVDNGDGTVNVSDGTNVFPLAKETIQQQAEEAQLARVAQFEQQRVAENAAYQQAIEEESRPQYALNDLVSLRDENGNAVRGNITTDADADGRYEVYTEAPINGKRVNLFTRDELDSMLMEHNGVVFEQPADNEGNNGGENIPESGNNAPQNIPAMQRIPKDMQGNPLYEQTDSDTAWDAIVEQTEGDEAMAQTVADGMVTDKEAALKKLEKTKSKGGVSIAEKIAAEKERKTAIDAAKQELDIWKRIAGTANRRKMEADAERKRIEEEAVALRKAEEEKMRAEREETERVEREYLNGVPDMVNDTPQDARARGYRRVNGHKIDRQEPIQALQGKEIAVKFSDNTLQTGRVAVIEAGQLQPSHIRGVRNPLHFIDEAQPKERNDEASVLSAQKIAGNIRPEEITSSVTAYTGAPTVNARGEAIQGNNRSDALRLMWESHPKQAAKYKQYLIDHAREFGLNAEDIAGMQHPVLVNMLDVEDVDAINLGQFVAQDTESGGIERIKAKNALHKMGNDMRSFASLLLKSNDEEASFAGLVDSNGTEVLKWMSQKGYITPTQYRSAFDSKGNLTAEAKNDLRGIMYQSIFKGGSTRLEEMFNAMPAKAQKAILATAFRDYDSSSTERMVGEIQNSIRAYHALSQSEDFVKAKTYKDVRLAVEAWKNQYQIDDATGESYLPAESFSNFALLLATMYKGDNQSVIQGTFNKLYDLIQGTQEPNLFEQPDNTPRTLAQAIKKTLNITYDGQRRSDVLVGDSSASQRGQQGSTGDAQAGERIESGERTADSAGSIEAESTAGGETIHQPQPERKGLEQTPDGGRETDGTGVADDATQEVLGASNRGDIRVLEEGLDTSYREYSEYSERTRRTTESERLVSLAKQHGLFIPAEVTKTLTGKYPKRTGESVVYIDTAAGKVTKVKDPYAKSAMKSGVQPEDAAFEHLVHNLLFPETAYTLEGISEEMGDVRIVLSQDFIQNYDQPTKEQIAEALAARGLFPEDNYSFGNELVSVTDVEGDNVLLGEDGTVFFIDPIIRFKKPLREILAALGGAEQKAPTIGEQVQAAEAEVNTNPTEAQKEAGNYKKGHVQIGTFNVTIEQPKGSVRSGVDADGKKWETTMQNTYGYIRGTEGVDGDHIDVFLSDDIDDWNDRKVFVVDQYNEDGTFDEHKVMFGFNDMDDAYDAYLSNYEKGWSDKHKIIIRPADMEVFEKWIASSHRKTKPFSEYKNVQLAEKRANESRLSEIKSRIDELHKEQEAAHNRSDIFEEARIIAESNELFAEQRKLEQSISNEETTTPTISQKADQVDNAAYAIAPSEYTTKKGKVLAMHFVKFNSTLTKEQQRAAKELAKANKGWYDTRQGGFMMRSEESAQQLAETILGNEEAVSDAQPISLVDTRKAIAPQGVNVESLFNALHTKGEAKLSDHVEQQPTATNENRLVTDERYAELRERMRKKLGGQMNIGIDPEILAIGTEMAVYHLEKGARKFAEYATAMIEDLGEAVRPYLKSFYNGARNLPEVESSQIAADMTPYDEVQQFDVATLGKEHSDPFTVAEIIVAEQAHEQEAEQAKLEIINQRNIERRKGDEERSANTQAIVSEADGYNGFKRGDKVLYAPHGKGGKVVEAIISDFEQYGNHNPVLDTGLGPVLYEVAQWDDIKPIGSDVKQEKVKTSKRKSVTLQKLNEADLFDGLFDNETNGEDGLRRTDAARSKGASANDSRYEEGLSRGTEASSESEQQGRRRTDLGGERTGDAVDRTVRPRLSDTLENKGIDGRRKKEISIPKNTRNNHSDRGKDHSPTSVESRIEANIKAIELAKQLLESGEQATENQMQTLRKFSGWGGLGKAFSEGTYYAPNPTQKQLRELLGEEAYQQAVMSANSAYYTPAYVVDTLWDIAEQMGFEGGNILEGSAGIGNILGQMPAHISERSDIHAIEIDGTSGGILSLLYPDAKVDIQGFEDTRIANGSVDLAITNVPFVTGLRVNDTTGDKDLSKKFHNIHDFCIAKNVRKLREGGLGIFITSNGTLDNSKKLRDWIVSEGGADFVGAFRMHNKTFSGTGVTSDIIVIRKRVNGKKSANAIDVSTVTGERVAEYETGEMRKTKGKETPIIKQISMDYNRYFVEHPENMAGEMLFAFEKGDTFRPTSKGLYPKQDKKQEQMLAEFVQSFTAEEFGDKATGSVGVIDEMPGKKIGEVFVKDGGLYINAIGASQPLDVNANKVKGHTKVECFEAYSAIKDALADVLEYQTNNENDKGLKPLLAKLNKVYDDFVATYGHFNKNTAISFLRNDLDYANVFALEKFEETADANGNKVQKFDKTDVFSKRVIEKEAEPSPTNVKDGIIASFFKFGRVDISYISEQLGWNEDEVKREIIEGGYGFEDPVTRQVEASYQYLSGNVREKLRQVQENNESGEYDRNLKALQDVMPMTIPAHLIDFTLGSSWIEPKMYEDYVKERTEVDVKFTAVGGTWFMSEPYHTSYEKNRAMGVISEKLERTIMGHTLIEAAIQNKTITISATKKNVDGSIETITDKEATQACSAKIEEIRQDFKEWAREKMQSDAEMSERMERVYNDTFNNYVPLNIPDEFIPKYFGGASHKFKMRLHQGRAIVRGTMQPLLLAHEVGTGKTFTLISTAMEMRRLGTARKPMIVVQNATVGQFVESAKELYPNAKILTLEEADRSAEGRKNFYAKIKYNDWDMIVVPQSTFEFIPDSEERQIAFVQEKIEEKMLVLEQMRGADPYGKSMITRQAEREIALLEEELAGLSGETGKKRTANDEKKRAVALQNAEVKAMEMLDRRTDDVENFDDMGIDALLIDEAHEYKHLGFATAMQRGVKGVDPSYSKKSQGVFLKTRAVLERNNGRNVIFATGTPISNTAAEIWTFMRYLMPADTMKEYGIYYFDDFVRNFGNIQQMLEFTTSGKFKENNRFAGYINLPELVRIWSGVSDTVLTKEAGEVSEKIPEMEGGKAQDLYLPQTRALRSIMKYVKVQLEAYDKMSGKRKKENSHIPLTMYGIAKAAAVDARLVQSDAEDETQSKTNEAVRQALRSLKESAGYKGTVAIFADNYQNKESGFNLYEDIRTKLIAAGVPTDEIVVIKSGMTVKKKLEIFEKVNRGEVRVILGSTFTLGTGVNIQERLYTLIHLDAPNRPMDYTQRNGRILRQGNLHKNMGKAVRVLRFGVEDSLDVTAYQRLKTKGAIADSIMNGKQMMANSMTNRVLEEEEDVFGDTVAQLSGSEYAMLKNNAEKNVRKYTSRKKQWEADQTYIHNAKPRIKGFIKDAEQRIEEYGKYLSAVRKAFPDGQFAEVVIGKQHFKAVDEMEGFFKEHNKSLLSAMKQMKEGEIAGDQKRGLTVQIGDFVFNVNTSLTRTTIHNGVTLFSDVERKMTYSCAELGLENVPVHQNLLRNAIEDIVSNVITGKDFAERLEAAEHSKKHSEAEMEQLLSREGRPFEYEAELARAKELYEEYSEAMKKELEKKEAKYAEMDATVEAAENLINAEEDDVLYRSDEIKDRIEELFHQAISGEFKGRPVSIGRLTDEGKAYLEQISGVTFKDYVDFVLNPSDLLHIYKGHFGKNETDERSIPLDIEDIRSIEDVISSPDRIIYSKESVREKRKMFFFLKEAENGTYNLLEIYADKKGNLTAKTFYKTKEGVSQRTMSLSKSLHTTSKTDGTTLSGAKIPQMFESKSVENIFSTREGEGAYNNDEVSFENNPIDNSRFTRALAVSERQRMTKRVEDLAKKLHLEHVEIVTDASVLDGKKRHAKGFYSKSTGKITIVIPNHRSTFDVEQTLLHEAVAHYGLRQLFGEQFDTFLDNVFNHADEAVRKRIVALAAKNGWDFRKATEEYLAKLAENTEFENIGASWWKQIRFFFLEMLHKIGFDNFRDVTLTDNELRYILWRSYENLTEPGGYRSIWGEAADVAKQYALGVGNYTHSPTALDNNDELYRDGDPEIHERELARDRYERRVKSGMFQSREALQDSMLGLKEAMDAILGKSANIEEVDGFENAYLGENRLSSVNKAEADAFAHTLFKPMLDEVAKLAGTERAREELTDYMMAKHGLERNAYMRNEAINNGSTDAEQTDYAGLTALTGLDNVAEAETEAQRMVDDYERIHDTVDLWEKVNAVSKAILEKSYECGMMSKATFEKVSDMYEFYIPLRGFDEKTSADAYAYLTHAHSAFNAPIKKAEGRRSKADDPFANLQSMAESSIMQGNRNKLVKQRFLNFVLNHPSDLVSVSDLWLEFDAVADEWKPVFPDNIDSSDTPDVVEQKMQDFETKMEALSQNDPTRYKRGKDAIGIPYRIVESRDMRQHQVIVKRGGKDYVITINGNPRAAQALNGQTNPDNDMSGAIGAILRAGEKINRQLSAFYTTRNPDFIVSNFVRDMLYTNTIAWIKESPNYAWRFHKNYLSVNPIAMKRLLKRYRKGMLDMNDKTDAMFYQFIMNGGETGYSNIRDIEQHKNDIRKELRRANGKLKVDKAFSLLAERFDELNRAVENCARFAAFVTSREFGRSIDRSIYDAKEISVNFNKKGSGAKFYDSIGQTRSGNASALVSGLGRSGFVFWNAAIQGSTNFGRQLKRYPAKAFTGMAAMFLLGAIVAYLGGDDEEDDKNAYYNLPEYVRRSNILFRAGDSWISIPLPIEYRAMYGMGELMISILNGKEHLTSGEIAESIAGQATQILPIDFLEGGGGAKAFIPSAVKPLVEAYVVEKSWTGMPLYKDTPFNKDMPEWTKAYKSANKHIVGLASAMNEATGGDSYTKGGIDFNPAQVEYMLNGYFSGVFNTIDKLTKTAETIVGEREYDPRSILLVNRLVKAGDERTEYRAVNNEYSRLQKEHDRLKMRLRHYEEDTDNGIFDYAEKIDFLYNSPEYERYEIFEEYRKDIDDLYEELKETVDEDERRDIEAELNEVKKEMIQEINLTRKRK